MDNDMMVVTLQCGMVRDGCLAVKILQTMGEKVVFKPSGGGCDMPWCKKTDYQYIRTQLQCVCAGCQLNGRK